jgi:6-phosphogluconolactonase
MIRMTAAPEVVVHSSPDLLAKAVAARLVTRLVDAQAAGGSASVVLTGGGIGTAVLRELRDSPARDAVDWRLVDVWWGDERFVPADDPQRNDVQAREALLGSVPVDPARVHPFPSADGPLGDDPEAAAERYAAELAAATRPEDHGDVPRFDVLVLGVGEEGHIASIFPDMPAVYDERSVVAVRGSPKPPPVRLSLTFQAISAATEVWLVVSGAAKAPAVALALGGAGPTQVPAAGARGRARTLWLLDRAAASRLPAGLARLPLA